MATNIKEKLMEEKEIVKAEVPVQEKMQMSESGALVEMAINKDLDIDKLERVLNLHKEMKEGKNKEDFDYHFSEMQKEFTPIKRTQKGDKGNYSPVDELVKKYGNIISKHGFHYSWNEEILPDKSLKIMLTISGYGHDKMNSKVLPEYIPDTGAKSGKAIMNVLQAEGTRSTYGYRYTFKAGFGITETDEDTDGDFKNFNDAIEYAEDIVWIKACNDLDSLVDVWKKIYTRLKKDNDNIGRQILIDVYQKRKGELTE